MLDLIATVLLSHSLASEMTAQRPNLRSLQRGANHDGVIGAFIVFFFVFFGIAICTAVYRSCSEEADEEQPLASRTMTTTSSDTNNNGTTATGQRRSSNTNLDVEVPSKIQERQKIERQLITRHYIEEDDAEHIECAICLSAFVKGQEVAQSVNSECTHLFHTDCIIDWLLTHNACPECRRDFLAPTP